MQDEKEGVPIKNAKSFMSKVPSVFTGKLSALLLFPFRLTRASVF